MCSRGPAVSVPILSPPPGQLSGKNLPFQVLLDESDLKPWICLAPKSLCFYFHFQPLNESYFQEKEFSAKANKRAALPGGEATGHRAAQGVGSHLLHLPADNRSALLSAPTCGLPLPPPGDFLAGDPFSSEGVPSPKDSTPTTFTVKAPLSHLAFPPGSPPLSPAQLVPLSATEPSSPRA